MTYDRVERARQFLPRLPEGGFFSHVTAAQIWGLPLPTWAERDLRPHVSVPSARRSVDTADAIGHAVRLRSGDVTDIDGLPVSSAARLWRELSPMLGRPDLIALGDAMLHRQQTTLGALVREVQTPRFRGRRTAFEALSLLDERAESHSESLLRVALLDAGIGPLAVNEPLQDGQGRFVARPDLRLVDALVVIEYDGDGHRIDAAQWRKDVRRFAAIEDLGFRVVRVTADDLPNFRRTVARVRRLLSRVNAP